MEQNLEQYKIFFEVAKAGNISHAAKHLYLSQPAVSKAISRLEDSLGIQLFERRSRGVKLTAAGTVLYEKLTAAFSAVDDAERQLQRFKMASVGAINIGTTNALCRYILFPFLSPYSDENPYVYINLHTQDTMTIVRQVEEGQIDLGVVALTEAPKNLTVKKLKTIHDVIVATPQYIENIKVVEGPDCDPVSDGKVLVLGRQNLSRQLFDAYTAKNHIMISKMYEISTMDIIIELCKINLGVGVVTREYVEEELRSGKFVELQKGSEIAVRTIYLIYQTENTNPALHKFLELTERRHDEII